MRAVMIAGDDDACFNRFSLSGVLWKGMKGRKKMLKRKKRLCCSVFGIYTEKGVKKVLEQTTSS
jgi:hypothetical protein